MNWVFLYWPLSFNQSENIATWSKLCKYEIVIKNCCSIVKNTYNYNFITQHLLGAFIGFSNNIGLKSLMWESPSLTGNYKTLCSLKFKLNGSHARSHLQPPWLSFDRWLWLITIWSYLSVALSTCCMLLISEIERPTLMSPCCLPWQLLYVHCWGLVSKTVGYLDRWMIRGQNPITTITLPILNREVDW